MTRKIWCTICLLLFTVSWSSAYVRTTEYRTGRPTFWDPPVVTLTLSFSGFTCVMAPGECYALAAEGAAQNWSEAGSRFTFRTRRALVNPCELADGINGVSFATSLCGFSFPPGTLAVANSRALPTGQILESDVVFNVQSGNGFFWDVYEGPQLFAAETPIYDFYRVAAHEFGHVLGLAHPDDYGQRVRALMNARTSNIDRPQPDDLNGVHAIYGSRTPLARTKGALENPGHQTFKSGISVISGWVCEAQRIEIMIGPHRLDALYGSERADTAGVCGHTNTGFGLLINWNNLGDGVHTVRLLVDGQPLGNPAEVKVTTFGQQFVRGLEGVYTLLNFPYADNDTLIGWDQNSQNFSILDRR